MNSQSLQEAPKRNGVVLDVERLVRRHESDEGVFEVCLPFLSLRAGEFCAVVGPSGSGKSTLLDLLALVLKPSAVTHFTISALDESAMKEKGSFDVVSHWNLDDEDALAVLRRNHLGYVLQTGGLFAFLTVGENIELPKRLCHQTVDHDETLRAMKEFGLTFGYKKPVSELSGGERQRVAILRALAHRPALVLADEPTAAVDSNRAHGIVQGLRHYAETSGAAVLMVTHDLSLVNTESDRTLSLELDGPSKQRGGSSSVPIVRYIAVEKLGNA